MKSPLQKLSTRLFLSAITLASAVCLTSNAQAQLPGLDRFNISRMGGRSTPSNLDRVLPQVFRTVETLQAVRGRSMPRPAPNPPRVCPAPAPPRVGTPLPPPPVAGEVPNVEDTKVSLARSLVEKAKTAFANQDYARTTDTLTEVLKLVPEDANAYQFRSLAFFAQQDFEKAAADAYDSFRFGNSWTWETVVTIYPKNKSSRYTEQLRSLEKVNKSDQQSMPTHFLLAYHYIVLGHLPQAERELGKVLTINPEEKLSQQLLAVVKNAQQADKLSQK